MPEPSARFEPVGEGRFRATSFTVGLVVGLGDPGSLHGGRPSAFHDRGVEHRGVNGTRFGLLIDRARPIGRSVQTLLVEPR